jgi:hypothetical protein
MPEPTTPTGKRLVKEVPAHWRSSLADILAIEREAREGALPAIEEVLSEYGLRTYDRDGIHRWRCEYPDRYGPCDCFAEMMQAIRDAALAAYEEARR